MLNILRIQSNFNVKQLFVNKFSQSGNALQMTIVHMSVEWRVQLIITYMRSTTVPQKSECKILLYSSISLSWKERGRERKGKYNPIEKLAREWKNMYCAPNSSISNKRANEQTIGNTIACCRRESVKISEMESGWD